MSLLLLACTPFPCGEGELLLEDGSCVSADEHSAPPVDSEEPDPLGEHCEPTSSAEDALVFLARSYGEQAEDGRIAEMIDMHHDASTQIVWTVGQGGSVPIDVSDPRDPQVLGWLPKVAEFPRFHRIEPFSEERWVVSTRDTKIESFDPRRPGEVQMEHLVELDGVEALAVFEGLIFASSRSHGIVSYRLDGQGFTEVARSPGLGSPWDFSEVDELGWTYLADNELGVVPVQLHADGSASIGAALPLEGSVLHTELDGDRLAVCLGSQGVALFDRSEPGAPVEVGRLSTGGSALMSALDGDHLWIVDHEGVAVVDISDPSAPRPLGYEITEGFALAVDAHEGVAYVGDWSSMDIYELDESVQGVDLDLASDRLHFDPAGGSGSTTLTNRGSGVLELQGALLGDERLELELSTLSLGPGESTELRVHYSGGEELESSICLASNDGDGGVHELSLGLGDAYVGQIAPDFVLEDLDGDSHRLAEELGHPVLLAYFASW